MLQFSFYLRRFLYFYMAFVSPLFVVVVVFVVLFCFLSLNHSTQYCASSFFPKLAFYAFGSILS